MKKLLAIIAISAITFSATAQEQRDIKKKHHAEQRHGKGHKGEKMKELNLTDAQKSQLKSDREAFKLKMAELEKNESLTVKEYRLRKAALQKEQHEKMRSLLTAEQKAKLTESRKKDDAKRQEMQARRIDKMKSELNLTDEQDSKLKAQNEATRMKMKAIKDNESLSQEERKVQIKALKESAKAQRKTILTAEQLKKLEERREKKLKQARK